MQNSQIPISKQQPIPVSPYKDGRKDHDFVNPSLISHDVFYNLEYPKKDRNIPHCHKRQEITEKITNNLNNVRSLTPQPSKSIQNMGGNEMRSSYKKSPISQQNYNYRSNKEFFNRNDNKIIENNKNENNNDNKLFNNNEYNNRINGSTENFNQDNGYHENYNKNNYSQNDDIINDNKKNNNNYKNLNYKSHQNLHLEDYEEITPKIINSGFENTDSKTVNIKENYKIRNEINTTPNNKQDNDKINGVTPRKTQEDDLKSKSETITSFTRNKDNLICDYCINQDLTDLRQNEREAENQRNKQLQQLNERFYQTLQYNDMVRQNERANLLKETRQAQLLTIENRKNQNISERKNLVMFEKEISEARKEENKLHSEREKVQEREKREALKRDLEIQIQNKIQQKTEYLNDKNNYNNGSFLNINNQYNNPYLPNRREYFIEIERQKQNKRERSLKEKEEQKKNYLFNINQQKKFEAEESKQMKEDNKRKQIYAQKILQDIEDKKNRDMVQKETEMNYYRTMFERINQEEKNKTLQQFYDKKLKETRTAQNLKDQIFEKKSFNLNSHNDEKIKRELAEIEDILAAQKIKNYNCMKCHKVYPKTVLNKCKVSNCKH